MTRAPLRFANILHIYQPAGQQKDILEAVAVQSYRPVLQGIRDNKQARLTMNVAGALMEQFDNGGFHDIIDLLRTLGREGKIEFTGSAKYHAFLPFLSDAEIIRQITLNDETNAFFLGKEAYRPRGFFPPELAYREGLEKILEQLGFSWMALDEIALCGKVGEVDYAKQYRIAGSAVKAVFRERRASNLVMSAIVRSSATLEKALSGERARKNWSIVTAMDGETFGHHRPGLEQLFFELLESPRFGCVTVSELLAEPAKTETVTPIRSTWASSEQDIERGVQFLSWNDPENPIHVWQKQLTDYAREVVYAAGCRDSGDRKMLERLDAALASDHFWWASGKPWWSLEMIEAGAFHLLELIRSIPEVPGETLHAAQELYEKIVSTAFEWQRSGEVRRRAHEQQALVRIPFKDRTIGKGGAEEGVYRAFLDMMRKLEKKAVKNREYEQAILWRDAMYKIEHGTDIYDAVSAIDLLRTRIPHAEMERTIKRYKEVYRKLRGGQPEQRGS